MEKAVRVNQTKKLLSTDMENLLVPIWIIVVLIIGIVGLLAWAVAVPLQWFSPLFAPFLMVLLAFSGFSFFYVKQSDTRRKAYKSWFDVAWNFWTIIGTAFLFYAKLEHTGYDLPAMLASLNAGCLALAFAFAFSSATGRFMISVCDAKWPPKPAQK